MPGLVPSKEVQESERLLHCAAYVLEERAPDDPLDALKRVLCSKSDRPISDLLTFAFSPGLAAKHLGMRLFESNVMPQWVHDIVINAIIKQFPNFAVREFRSRSQMHKLADVVIEGITEQRPDPESRITLSEKCDALGVPIVRVNWRIDDEARRSLMRLGQILATELPRAGLPAPLLEDWVEERRPQDGVIIDMGHTTGTTRMSDNAKLGVVEFKLPGAWRGGALCGGRLRVSDERTRQPNPDDPISRHSPRGSDKSRSRNLGTVKSHEAFATVRMQKFAGASKNRLFASPRKSGSRLTDAMKVLPQRNDRVIRL